jgi:hypothetical protein
LSSNPPIRLDWRASLAIGEGAEPRFCPPHVMDKIDRFGQLMGALRRLGIASSRGRSRASASAEVVAPRGSRISIDALQNQIRERLRALPPEESERDSRAAGIFVESVLLWELGDAMLADSEFSGLVQHVKEQLESDSALSRQLRSLLEDLTG